MKEYTVIREHYDAKHHKQGDIRELDDRQAQELLQKLLIKEANNKTKKKK